MTRPVEHGPWLASARSPERGRDGAAATSRPASDAWQRAMDEADLRSRRDGAARPADDDRLRATAPPIVGIDVAPRHAPPPVGLAWPALPGSPPASASADGIASHAADAAPPPGAWASAAAAGLHAALVAATGTSPGDRLRVHAEWSDEGVRLWIGANRGGGVLVGALLRELRRRLGAHGVPLASVVCNGRTVHDLPHRQDPEVPCR